MGPDVHIFQPRRFLKQQQTQIALKGNASPAYRPFGGGASLCPGRHFVTLEAMALTAYFVLRFDVEPIDGPLRVPAQKQESMATNVFPPAEDTRVHVRQRQGYERVTWDFLMT